MYMYTYVYVNVCVYKCKCMYYININIYIYDNIDVNIDICKYRCKYMYCQTDKGSCPATSSAQPCWAKFAPWFSPKPTPISLAPDFVATMSSAKRH